jgi:hypothetical protein
MATDLHPVRGKSPKPPATAKYESFIETQLARARWRIRGLDLAAAGLGFISLTLIYGLAMALCDRWLDLSALARQLLFAIFVLGGSIYLALLVVRPLFQRVNPCYAARRLEDTLPGAKNSVVNWVDLHDDPLAPALRSALSRQAARDLTRADLEQAISARRTSWLCALAGGLFVGLLALYVLGPPQFVSLMKRAFAPFIEAAIASRTQITLVQPEGGDVTVPIGRAVAFSVWIDGRVPDPARADALRLLYRYNPGDPFEERPLEAGESHREWGTTLLATEIRTGLWYKVAGGDAETPEFRIQVRSTPLLTGFDVKYHYRPYLRWQDRASHDPNLQELRGTEVTLLAHTNRTVRQGQLTFASGQSLSGDIPANDPQALRFRLILDNDSTYQIWFTSTEGERDSDPMPYTIRVLHDRAPQVELKKPGEDVPLPANGILRLEGSASDDFGLVGLKLHLQAGKEHKEKPYRGGKALHVGDGGYPQMLEYKDFVELKDWKLAKDSVLEYWLEATDNCDYPGPNVSTTPHFKVQIKDPDRNEQKQQQERVKAEGEQKKHEQAQDQKLQQQQRGQSRRENIEKSSGERKSEPSPAEKNAGDGKDQPSPDQLKKKAAELEKAIQQASSAKQQPDAGSPQNDAKGTTGQNPSPSNPQDQANPPQKNLSDGNQRKGGEPGSPESKPADGQPSGKQQPKPAPNEATEKQQEKGHEHGEPTPGQPQIGGEEGSPSSDAGDKHASKNKPIPAASQNPKGQGTGPGKQDSPQPNEPKSGSEGGQAKGSPNGPMSDKPSKKPSGDGQEKGSTAASRQGHNNGDQKGKPDGPQSKDNPPSPTQPGAEGTDQRGQQSADPQGTPDKGGTKNEQFGGKNGSQANEPNNASAMKGGDASPNKEGAKPQEQARDNGERQEGSGRPNAGAGTSASQPKKSQNTGGKGQAGKGGENASSGAQPNAPAGQEKQPFPPQANKSGTGKSGHGEGGQAGGGKPKSAGKGNSSEGTQGSGSASGQPGTGKPDTSSEPSDGTKGGGQPTGEKPSEKTKAKAESATHGGNGEKGKTAGEKEPGKHGAKTPNQDASTGDASKGESSPGKPKGSAQPKGQSDQLGKPGGPPRGGQSEQSDRQPDAQGRPSQQSQAEKGTGQQSGRAGRGQESTEGTNKKLDRSGRSRTAEKGAGQSGAKQSSDRQDGQPNAGQGNDQKGGPSGNIGQPSDKADSQHDGQRAGNPAKNGTSAQQSGDSGGQKGEEAGNRPGSGQTKGGRGTGSGNASGGSGGPNLQGRAPGSRGPGSEEPEPITENNGGGVGLHRAGELQLESIKKHISKDVLKRANMTEAEYQKFLKAYEDLLKRQASTPAMPDKLMAPLKGPTGALPNRGVRIAQPGVQVKPGTVERGGPTVPPPEFREAQNEFSRRLSELERLRNPQ